MKDHTLLFVISFWVLLGIAIWLIESIANSIKYKKLKPQFDNLEKSIKDHESKVKTENFILDEKIRLWNPWASLG
jgi:Holliday junction resolvase RusA-like endonuclease